MKYKPNIPTPKPNHSLKKSAKFALFLFSSPGLIPPDTIRRIRETADIVEVVGDFVQLKRSGSSYKALSPFTQEKTPSFFVSPAKGIFKCFSTGKGGDAISFIMEIEGLSYPDALRWLANKYNIEIEEQVLPEVATAGAEAYNRKESILVALNFAKDFYRKQLDTDEGKAIGLSYFKERGFTGEIIERFELGYSPDAWTAFYDEAVRMQFNPEILEAAGLTLSRDDKSFYDRFRHRVMFPVHSLSGKTIAFGARILVNDKKQPKYVNSPESDVYHKSDVLYGLWQGKKQMRLEGNTYLVEGYTDVISMHMAGIENVVASSGTSLTDEQILLIKRFSPNVTVLYDGDNAGIKASLRGIDMMLEKGLNVYAVLFPAGEDPDSYRRTHGPEALKSYLSANRLDFLSFKLKIFAEEASADPIRKAELIKDLVGSIFKVDDPVKRAVFFKEMSQKLDVDEQVLLSEYNKLVIARRRENAKRDEPEILAGFPGDTPEAPPQGGMQTESIDWFRQRLINIEKEFIRILLTYASEADGEGTPLARTMVESVDGAEFADGLAGRIFVEVKERLEQGQSLDDPPAWLNNPELTAYYAGLVSDKYEISTNWSKFRIYPPKKDRNVYRAAEESIGHVVQGQYRLRRKLMQESLKKPESAEEELTLLQDIMALMQEERAISKKFGVVYNPL